MQLGILGLDFKSDNRGCQALAYSFLEIINSIGYELNENYTVCVLIKIPNKILLKEHFDLKKLKAELIKKYLPSEAYSNIDIISGFYYTVNGYCFLTKEIKECSFIYDFSEGDSFTDIYGKVRFVYWSSIKKSIVRNKINLILGSQTIGPFISKKNEKVAAKILQNARKIYVRDKISKQYVKQIARVNSVLTTDIAFGLPYNKVYSNSPIIGINISGLLWNGGYTGNNQFCLTVDYKKFCLAIIDKILNEGKYRIVIVPHVISNDNNIQDNDLFVAREICNSNSNISMIEKFDSPISIKSYISSFTCFMGSRMHSTIAAMSVGIPVIPFSYSRKFEGLFQSLDYEYIIHGCTMTTEEAIESAFYYIDNMEILTNAIQKSKKIIEEKNNFLREQIMEDLINGR